MDEIKSNLINISQDNHEYDWKRLSKMSGIAVIIQIICSFMTMIVVFTIGGEPSTPEEYFSALNENRIIGILRLDLPSVINLSLYFVVFLGIFAAFREKNRIFSLLCTALAFMGVSLVLTNNSALSMIHLSDQYATATTIEDQSRILAAAEAVIASDMWHSTGAFIGGILLQSALLFLSIIMLQNPNFNKSTAYVGTLMHGLDLLHIMVLLFSQDIGAYIMVVAGTLYLIWFPLLSRDLIKYGRSKSKNI